jgi:hypothetical protein
MLRGEKKNLSFPWVLRDQQKRGSKEQEVNEIIESVGKKKKEEET